MIQGRSIRAARGVRARVGRGRGRGGAGRDFRDVYGYSVAVLGGRHAWPRGPGWLWLACPNPARDDPKKRKYKNGTQGAMRLVPLGFAFVVCVLFAWRPRPCPGPCPGPSQDQASALCNPAASLLQLNLTLGRVEDAPLVRALPHESESPPTVAAVSSTLLPAAGPWSDWGPWSRCSRSCTVRRYRACADEAQCGRDVLRDQAYCFVEGGFCHGWLQKKALLQQDRQWQREQQEQHGHHQGRGRTRMPV